MTVHVEERSENMRVNISPVSVGNSSGIESIDEVAAPTALE
jgi:hypothetical protein